MPPIDITLLGHDEASSAIGGVSGALGGLADIAGGALSVALGGLLTDAIHGAEQALGSMLSAALDNEGIQARLASAIKASGGAAGITAEQANTLAQKFTDLAGGSDDVILAIETIAIRAGTISSEEMPAFIQTTLDLGAVMGSTEGAATLLARAQEDVSGAVGKAQRAGIIFTDAQKAQIKTLEDSGDKAGALKIFMDRLAEATGGAAAANAGTLSGQWEIFKGTLGEAAETVGMAVVPVLHDLFDQVIAPAIPLITEFATGVGMALGAFLSGEEDIQGASDILAEFANNVLPGSAEAIRNVGETVQTLWDEFQKAWPGIQAAIQPVVDWIIAQLPAVQSALATGLGWLMEHQEEVKGAVIAIGAVLVAAGIIGTVLAIGTAIAGLVTPIGLVIAAAAVLGAAWAGNWGGIRDILTDFWNNTAMPILTQLWNWLQVAVPAALQTLSDFWTGTLLPAINFVWAWMTGTLFPALSTLWVWLGTTLTAALQSLSTFWTETLQPAIASVWAWMTGSLFPTLSDLWTWLGTTLTAALQSLSDFWTGTLQPAIQGVWEWMKDPLFPFLTSLANLAEVVLGKAIETLAGYWSDTLQPALKDVWSFLNDSVFPMFKDIQAFLNDTFAPVFATVGAAIQSFIDGALGALQRTFDGISQTIRDVTGFINDLIALINSIPGIPGASGPSFSFGGTGTSAASSSVSSSSVVNLIVNTTGGLDVAGAYNQAVVMAGAY